MMIRDSGLLFWATM